MLKQKINRLNRSLARSKLLMPGVALVLVLSFVAFGALADRPDGAFAGTYSNAPTAAVDDQVKSTGQAATTKAADKPDSKTKNGATQPTASTSTATAAKPGTVSPPAASVPVAKPVPAPAPAPAGWTYPLHTGIKTTYFWAGEAASADNDYIQNVSSAWQTNWAAYFGGEDNPDNRCGYNPCGFTPKENPFYFALPYGDFTESGQAPGVTNVPWYDAAAQARLNNGQSILKNRWIQVNFGTKTVYAQWQDVGPFYSDDSSYVFGTSSPKSTRAGLDVSPAVRDYLGMGGSATTSWRFVTDAEVPAGPWKTTVTTSGTDWN